MIDGDPETLVNSPHMVVYAAPVTRMAFGVAEAFEQTTKAATRYDISLFNQQPTTLVDDVRRGQRGVEAPLTDGRHHFIVGDMNPARRSV
jgi:hypothetical protein